MFCSRCGKTLPPESVMCPACNHLVGESRFEGSPYTSAQSPVEPGQPPRDLPRLSVNGEYKNPSSGAYGTVTQNITRTTYTSAGEEAAESDEDARTSYRPVFESASVPEGIRDDMRETLYGKPDEPTADSTDQALQEAVETLSEDSRAALDDMDRQLRMDAIDLSIFRARPIESNGQTGISADVSELIQQIEAEPVRKSSRRKKPTDEYGEYSDNIDYVDPDDLPETEVPQEAFDNDQEAVFDDINDEEFAELRHNSFGPKQVLKISLALIVVAALFVGGVMWFRYIRGSQSSAPIVNVRETLYDSGIATIKDHASGDRVAAMLNAYASEGLTGLTMSLSTASSEIQALLPEDATENELLFHDALTSIETNIANCVTSDALAVSQQDTESVNQSDERWKIVENSILLLESARSAQELTAIINGEEVAVAEATAAAPTPTPAPNYNTLSKGAKSDEVLDMQNRLYQLGFLLDDRDGAFGTNTQTAVKMFQQSAGLPITGIADNETLTRMYADDAPRTEYAQPTPTPVVATPAPEATPEPAADQDAAANAVADEAASGETVTV